MSDGSFDIFFCRVVFGGSGLSLFCAREGLLDYV